MRRAWAVIVAAVVSVGVLLAPPRVRACVCASRAAVIIWPREGATDVPRDTPVVIVYHDSDGEPGSIEVALVSADGNAVALSEVERLPATSTGCASSETRFLRPSELLVDGASYTLSLSEVGSQSEPLPVTFTVGAGTFTPEPLKEVAIRYLHVEDTAPCSEVGCQLAEVHVDLGEPTREPRWVVVQSAAEGYGNRTFRFWPDDQPPTTDEYHREGELPIALPGDGDRCVQMTLHALDGSILLDERRCEPDRCARYEVTRKIDSCDNWHGSGLDSARIPEGSCDDPPVIVWAEDFGPVYPGDEPPGDTAHAAPSSGCSAARTNVGETAGTTGPLLKCSLVAVWMARRRRRPPTPTQPSAPRRPHVRLSA